MPFKFETYQIADISTAHITRGDAEIMGNPEGPCHVAKIDGTASLTHDTSPGDIFVVPLDEANFKEQLANLAAFGYSQQFLDLMTELHKQRIPYVRFDRDGGEVEGAPTFEW